MPSVKKVFEAAKQQAEAPKPPPAASAEAAKQQAEAPKPPPAASAEASPCAAPVAVSGDAKASAPGPARAAAAASVSTRRGAGQGTIEVIAKHAIQEHEVKVTLPKRACYKHIKKALAQFLGNDEILRRGQLMRKDQTYSALKDSKKIGDVRQVLVVCADFSMLTEKVSTCALEEDDVSSEDEPLPTSGPAGRANIGPIKPGILTRRQAVALQEDLLEGFSSAKFQSDLRDLMQRKTSTSMSVAEFTQAKQELYMTVQGQVLPRWGFDGSSKGVYKMLGAMGPFIKDQEFVEMGSRINKMIGVDSPPETWGDLSSNCKKLEVTEGQAAAKAKSRPKPPPRMGMGMGLGGNLMLGGFPGGAPSRGGGLAQEGGYSEDEDSLSDDDAIEDSAEFDPWPSTRPAPYKLHIVGSFNQDTPTEMDWDADAGMFVCPIEVGKSGKETFQFWVNGQKDRTLYPSVENASPVEAHNVCGPDSKHRGQKWQMGKPGDEEVKAGKFLIILAALDSIGKVRLVDWQSFSEEA